MGLMQLNMDGKNKIQTAIMRLQQFEPPEGYYLAYSGGKDSQVCRGLLNEARVKYDAHYNVALDPPELALFVRDDFPECVWEKQQGFNFWKKLVSKGFPLRQRRWCCEYLKEWGGEGRLVVTGVRWAESVSRKRNRQMVETLRGKSRIAQRPKACINPIIDWSNKEVWEYLKFRRMTYCALYDVGASGPYKGDGAFKRLGCVLCPMQTAQNTQTDLHYFPKQAAAWRRAFERLWERRKAEGNESMTKRWPTAEDMWLWWLQRENDKISPKEQQCFVYE